MTRNKDWPSRRDIEAEIERLIGLLDKMDGDADNEPELGAMEPRVQMPNVKYSLMPPPHNDPPFSRVERDSSHLHWAYGHGDCSEELEINDEALAATPYWP